MVGGVAVRVLGDVHVVQPHLIVLDAGRNELQEVAQASGEDLALHSVDAQPGRTPTSHAIQSEHCPLPTLTQLKPPFSASTSYFYLAQNIDNLISKRMGIRFYDEDSLFCELNYGDLCMLKLRGGHLRDYPSEIEWTTHRATQESFPEGFTIDDEFCSTSEFISYDENGKEPLFPFRSRSLIKESMINAGISEPKYNLLKTKQGVFITFNILEHCQKFDHKNELIKDWGLSLQWVLPKCYSLFFVSDKVAVHPL